MVGERRLGFTGGFGNQDGNGSLALDHLAVVLRVIHSGLILETPDFHR